MNGKVLLAGHGWEGKSQQRETEGGMWVHAGARLSNWLGAGLILSVVLAAVLIFVYLGGVGLPGVSWAWACVRELTRLVSGKPTDFFFSPFLSASSKVVLK